MLSFQNGDVSFMANRVSDESEFCVIPVFKFVCALLHVSVRSVFAYLVHLYQDDTHSVRCVNGSQLLPYGCLLFHSSSWCL